MFPMSWRCDVQRSPLFLCRYVTDRHEIGDEWYPASVLCPRRFAVQRQVDVLALRRNPLEVNGFESAIGDGFTPFLESRAGECLLREVVVRIVALLHAGVDERLPGCTDNFFSHLFVLADQFF